MGAGRGRRTPATSEAAAPATVATTIATIASETPGSLPPTVDRKIYMAAGEAITRAARVSKELRVDVGCVVGVVAEVEVLLASTEAEVVRLCFFEFCRAGQAGIQTVGQSLTHVRTRFCSLYGPTSQSCAAISVCATHAMHTQIPTRQISNHTHMSSMPVCFHA